MRYICWLSILKVFFSFCLWLDYRWITRTMKEMKLKARWSASMRDHRSIRPDSDAAHLRANWLILRNEIIGPVSILAKTSSSPRATLTAAFESGTSTLVTWITCLSANVRALKTDFLTPNRTEIVGVNGSSGSCSRSGLCTRRITPSSHCVVGPHA